MNNITAGVCEREDATRTRVAGHLDEIQGVVANRLDLFREGDIGFIDWLDERVLIRLGGLTGVEPASGEASVLLVA